MLLVHTSRVMDMGVNFADVVKVSMRYTFLSFKFSLRIQNNMQVELGQ